ncbi:MAG TPA: DNA-binding domain-containing protein [Caulobacteraceae bacterium]|nr:DNA-binding domain-containing protein [Caulobacteraceae bacterium]
MSSLAQLQTRMAQALWTDSAEGLIDQIAPGVVGAHHALGVHRNTIISGLTNTLRLTYPTVEWLVGEDFFDQAAFHFTRRYPPVAMQLSDYGREFPAFLESYDPAAELAYLPDTARFDLVVDQVAAQAVSASSIAVDLGNGVALKLDGSLSILRLTYPADRIRDARDQDGEALPALELTPGVYAYAVWRSAQGASVRLLPAGVAAFVQVVLAGGSAEAGLEALMLDAGAEALEQLRSDLFFAPFARLQTDITGETEP